MARRRIHEEQDNQERWLVSYADFITLLFAFFVVMYAVSSVNEGKYRILTDSLSAGFRGPPRSLEPIQFGELLRNQSLTPPSTAQRLPLVPSRRIDLPDTPLPVDTPPLVLPPELRRVVTALPDTALEPAEVDPLDVIAAELRRSTYQLVDESLMTIRRREDWVEVELNQSVVFPTGSAAMNLAAEPVLNSIAETLGGLPNEIHVEGHADSTPINTAAFPSNWELSAARAASLVDYLMRQGLDPQRLAAVGYGEHRPVADNQSAEGRARNRRVVVVVHAERGDGPGGAATAGPAEPVEAPAGDP